MEDRIKNLSLDQKAKLYYMALLKKGMIDTLPENPKAAYVQSMMDKEKEEMHDDPGDIRIDHDYYANEDYKPSHRAYNVIDKSNNDEIVAKELSRDKALELAHTNKNYMIDATDRLAETDAISTARSLRPGGEEDEEQDEYDKGWYGEALTDKEDDAEQEEYDKGWYGESLKELSTQLGYLKEAEYGKYFGGRTKGGDEESNQYQKVEFVYTEQGGRFYGLDVYVSKDQRQRSDKLRYDEANKWLKGILEYIHEGDLIPQRYVSGIEDLDLIVDRLKELGIEASHNDFMDVS